MKPRRPSRKAWQARMLYCVQRYRLDEIARGTLAPQFRHEHYFRMSLDDGPRVDVDDYILPGLMFALEAKEFEVAERRRAGLEDVAPAPPS